LGSLNGVVSTRSVWAGPKEVVHVTYDSDQLAYEKLLEQAEKMECTSAVYTFDDQQKQIASEANVGPVIPWQESLETRQVKKAEQKYYLRNTAFQHLPISELQAVKINVAVSPMHNKRTSPQEFLSPRQLKLLERIRKVLKRDPQALAGFDFPEDQSQLINYNQRLLEQLDKLEAP